MDVDFPAEPRSADGGGRSKRRSDLELHTELGPDVEALAFSLLFYMARSQGETDEIGIADVEAFCARLERIEDASTTLFKRILGVSSNRYSSLWQALRSRDHASGRESLARGLAAAMPLVPQADRAAFTSDVLRLASALGRTKRASLWRARRQQARLTEALRELEALCGAAAVGSSAAPAERSTNVRMSILDLPIAGAERARWRGGEILTECVAVVDEVPLVRTFRFQSVEKLHTGHEAGQFATLRLEIDGQEVRRSYTISSSPTRSDVLEFTIKRVPNGLVSNWLHDHMRPGMRIRIKGPSGRFCFNQCGSERVLMVGAGSGITPVLSMARFIRDAALDVDVVFLSAMRTSSDRIAHAELARMQDQLPRFRFVDCLSDASLEDGYTGLTGRVDLQTLLAVSPDLMERNVLLCGPQPFMTGVRATLMEAGFPDRNFFSESFGGKQGETKPSRPNSVPARLLSAMPLPSSTPRERPATPMPAAPRARVDKRTDRASQPPSIELVRSRRSITPELGQSVLEALEAAGVQTDSSCRAGTCGTCKIRIVSGEVRMHCEDGLGEEDRAQKYVLACVGEAVGRVELDL